MSDVAKLTMPDGKEITLPAYTGTEQEKCLDISALRKETGYVTFDPGFGNTCPSKSSITFLNGEAGILRYRGYSIEDLCEKSDFTSVMYLVIYGELPSEAELAEFNKNLAEHSKIKPQLLKLYESLPQDTHPMVLVSTMLAGLSAHYPQFTNPHDTDQVEQAIFIALGQILPIVSSAYCHGKGKEFNYPSEPISSYGSGLLKMMFGDDYEVDTDVEKILDELLILHADHEFNCSTSTARIVGSSQANLFASLSASVNALWGPLHGGANQKVIEMLEDIANDGGVEAIDKYLAMAKDKTSGFRLMGFGHRVYKNYDPRAKIIKKTCDKVIEKLGVEDPLLAVAQKLEAAALSDEYFTSRKLYPNVDFYSGIVYRALNIPTEMYTPLFALGRLCGWIAHWREQNLDPHARIGRPRQLYMGATERSL
ncbi:MAG: citrate synthase [Lentisphaeraceae bacterium]|nr:citrate synthase [Lentisphaeraceae bacterium]